jgi:hypothetical protein
MAIRIMAKGSVDQIRRYFTLVAERMTSLFECDREGGRSEKVGDRDTALNAGECVVLQVGKRKFARVTLS